ncbi:MAG TPA: glycoside hydrolase family 31 protein, partial [Puia sp.]|nr:glycoside hydrolase family 31 protein [Puia sp.]
MVVRIVFLGLVMQVFSVCAQGTLEARAGLAVSAASAASAVLPGRDIAESSGSKGLSLLPGEKWWGGAVTEGHRAPFEAGYSLDLNGDNRGNQAAPLLLSSAGRWVWSDQPFEFSVGKDSLVLSKCQDSVYSGQAGHSLAEAYRDAASHHFPASGKMPDSLLIMRPQYNTWIELTYNQNQLDILKYSRAVIDAGFPPGVFMIDDNWFDGYGRLEFRKDRFPDARDMIRQLHQMGFKVMVWVSPFISPDNEVFRAADSQRVVLYKGAGGWKGGDGGEGAKAAIGGEGAKGAGAWGDAKEPAIIHWWNGYSAVLDLTNPAAVGWFDAKLHRAVEEYGIDGFKFDAGDTEFYPSSSVPYRKANANEQCMLWGLFGLEYPLNEYRAMWKRGGQPLAERLRDKSHSFEDLQKLIPHTLLAGLLGYPFVCPD